MWDPVPLGPSTYIVTITNVDEAPIITAQDSVPTLTFDEGESGNILSSLSDDNRFWQITDEDLINDREDTYRYTLAVRRNGDDISGLFQWVNTSDEGDAGEMTYSGDVVESAVSGSTSFNRTVAFARTPDDADVGTYQVVATITDRGATATDPAARVTTSRTYTVTIMSVDDEGPHGCCAHSSAFFSGRHFS